ncbi:MAG: ATP-binding protein [Pseudomonadota bacterium]
MLLEIRATPLGVRYALGQITSMLTQEKVEAEALGTTELILAEVLNNVVEHAYADADEVGVISIRVCRLPTSLFCEIVDFGAGMPDGKLPEGRAPDITDDLDGLPEGGFGWSLILGLTEDLRYERQDNQNRLNFRIALPADTPLAEARG